MNADLIRLDMRIGDFLAEHPGREYTTAQVAAMLGVPPGDIFVVGKHSMNARRGAPIRKKAWGRTIEARPLVWRLPEAATAGVVSFESRWADIERRLDAIEQRLNGETK